MLRLSQRDQRDQGAATATASNEPILKADQLIAFFKSRMAVVRRKNIGNTHRLGGSGQLLLPGSL